MLAGFVAGINVGILYPKYKFWIFGKKWTIGRKKKSWMIIYTHYSFSLGYFEFFGNGDSFDGF
jgi:hypothetical protein